MSPGPAPGATCQVCAHPEISKINQALGTAVARRRIAAQFGVDSQALNRHYHNFHPGVRDDASAERGVDVADDATPRETLQGIIDLYKKKLKLGTLRTDEARELRIALDALDQMSGGAVPQAQTVRDIEGYAEYERALFEALEPFPEARKALAGALGARR